MSLPSTLDISNTNILNVDISIDTLSPQLWNLETLKLWKLHLGFSQFFLAPFELDISNADISNITLSPQIWNLEILKTLLKIFTRVWLARHGPRMADPRFLNFIFLMCFFKPYSKIVGEDSPFLLLSCFWFCFVTFLLPIRWTFIKNYFCRKQQ